MRNNIGASESASIFIFGVVGANLITYIFTFALSKTAVFGGMTVGDWLGYFLAQVAFIAVVIIYSRVRKINEFSVAKIRKPASWKQYILIPFIAVATVIAFLPLANLFNAFLNVIGFRKGIATPQSPSIGAYFLSLFVIALLPAFGEEFLIRGNLFHGLSSRGIWFGILISSLLFALMHGNPSQTVYQFFLGIVLVLVFVLSGSIWPCVILHFLNNFISLTISSFIPQIDEWAVRLGYWNWLTGACSMIVGVILLALLLYLFNRVGEKKPKSFNVISNEKVYDDYTITVSADAKASGFKQRFEESAFVGMWKFFGSLFTRDGWINVTHTLEAKNGVPYLGKRQPMINVWLAIGFVSVYWVIVFLTQIF